MDNPENGTTRWEKIVFTVCCGLGAFWLTNQWRSTEDLRDKYHEMNRTLGQIETHHSEQERRIEELEGLLKEHRRYDGHPNMLNQDFRSNP